MRNLILIVLILAFMMPSLSLAWEPTGVKILSNFTKNAILSDYTIEEVQEVPSNAVFIVDDKKLDLVADSEDIEKWLKGRKGKKFKITYGNVYGWLGDGEMEYEVLMDAKPLK